MGKWYLWRTGLHQTSDLPLPSWSFLSLRAVNNELDCVQITLRQVFVTQPREPVFLCFSRLIAHRLGSCAGVGCFFLCAQLLVWWGSTFWEREHVVIGTPVKVSSTPGHPFQRATQFRNHIKYCHVVGPLLRFVTKYLFSWSYPLISFKTKIRCFWFSQGSFDEIFLIYICISLVAWGAFLCAQSLLL